MNETIDSVINEEMLEFENEMKETPTKTNKTSGLRITPIKHHVKDEVEKEIEKEVKEEIDRKRGLALKKEEWGKISTELDRLKERKKLVSPMKSKVYPGALNSARSSISSTKEGEVKVFRRHSIGKDVMSTKLSHNKYKDKLKKTFLDLSRKSVDGVDFDARLKNLEKVKVVEEFLVDQNVPRLFCDEKKVGI